MIEVSYQIGGIEDETWNLWDQIGDIYTDCIIEIGIDYSEDNENALLESGETRVRLKYKKKLKDNKCIIGIQLFVDDEVIGKAQANNFVENFNRALEDLQYDERIFFIFKYFDQTLHDKLMEYYHQIFKVEMKLRQVISFIFIDTYQDDYFDLLKDLSIDTQLDKGTKNNQEKKIQYLKPRFENEFFHILFNQYKDLTKIKQITKISDLMSYLEIAVSFEELRNIIFNRGIQKEEYVLFLNRITNDIEPIEKIRNCVAHNRTPREEEIDSFEKALPQLDRKIDEFMAEIGYEEENG